MRNFSPAKKRVDVSPGESVRIIRELQGLSQTQLSELCGIPQTTISSIENGRVNLGVEDGRRRQLRQVGRPHRERRRVRRGLAWPPDLGATPRT